MAIQRIPASWIPSQSHLINIFIMMATCHCLLIYSPLRGPPRGSMLNHSKNKDWMSLFCEWKVIFGVILVFLKNVNRKWILRGSLTTPGFSCRTRLLVRYIFVTVLYSALTISVMLLRKSACKYMCRLHISRYAGMGNPPNSIDKPCVVGIYLFTDDIYSF